MGTTDYSGCLDAMENVNPIEFAMNFHSNFVESVVTLCDCDCDCFFLGKMNRPRSSLTLTMIQYYYIYIYLVLGDSISATARGRPYLIFSSHHINFDIFGLVCVFFLLSSRRVFIARHGRERQKPAKRFTKSIQSVI